MPYYTSASIVNAADSQNGPLAPNAIGSIYGQGLSYTTASLDVADLAAGVLPIGLGAVNVLVGGLPATLFYVSPTQINFLVPSILIPGRTTVQVVHDGLAGPSAKIDIADASPALFQVDAQTAIATRLDGSLVTSAAPGRPGDVLTLYATGLGHTVPPVSYRSIPNKAAPLERLAEFQVLLDGAPLDRSLVLYAGVAPGYAGLYQINVKMPDAVGPNPAVQISLGALISPPGLLLPLTNAE